MTAASPRRLLTVCLGNHCRSPLAAAVLARQGGAAVQALSAGIREKHVGRPAHPLMITAAAACGYDLTPHLGVQVSRELLDWADTVLAMDRNNLAALQDLADERTVPKLRLYLGDQDVPDPWGGDDAAFATVVKLIEDGAARHLT
ncbi:low molecular weight phosphotyrosine protein phosphatase [Streptomyces montanus]|uniref:protein-tyrosine-phosphatase n=1 Tax=Streptomyces montanus TaxID=2580423 RepID=A0A5R9FUX1_9ACTN|nr:low molecular weight protein-tyrosine-phosphatase [Streptomyces montanus]TLS45680.1 low molecular weight phosphotyrosine protein phosphatase [Streptomyces montanus]